jgi:phosphate transport system permease protein
MSVSTVTTLPVHREEEATPIGKPVWPVSDLLFQVFAWLSIIGALSIVAALLVSVVIQGSSRLSLAFLTGFPSRFAEKAGIAAPLVGSACLMVLTVLIALPVGVGAAIYLEEYAPRNRMTRLIEINIANLAGVPSIIYGLLGLQIFVRVCNFERSLLSGALTLGLLVLPVIILTAREAIRIVPKSFREASLALGATKWQTIRSQVLPVAYPGIMTGCILAFSRAIGETAPLVSLGALTYVAFLPDSIWSAFTALPIQIFNWVSRPQEAFHVNAAAAILVLMFVLMCMNIIAIIIRLEFQKRFK